ncbi:MAG TPA: CoA-binding protein [Candidatus Goldiibacteriota bacterium]|nr:CoA-binding protein [Candidatus Goldiibacteriota bacterium]
MSGDKKRVVVLGASNKPERYSHQAVEALDAAGFEVIPVNPALKEILGKKVAGSLTSISGEVDTVTLYLGPERLKPLIDDIIRLKPRRVISNPGTETREMRDAAEKAGILYIEACTLVMLRTGQF